MSIRHLLQLAAGGPLPGNLSLIEEEKKMHSIRKHLTFLGIHLLLVDAIV
ncbi:MAG TPA: hypothetical protein VE130_04210 [Nitrososphaeraceae archaeon]|nr:hypothetical protein [Nitrososphaeraceae archaeon]